MAKHYGTQTVILLDEYDKPVQDGYIYGYYDEIIRFMRALLSGAFKDNSSLYMGAITGVTRVSKESIFSGLNNIDVDTVFSRRFSQYFGFTKQEAAEMFSFYGAGDDKLKEAEDWYDGYIFGETEIYNPWSLLSYLKEDCSPGAYWLNMSTNDLAKDCIRKASLERHPAPSSDLSCNGFYAAGKRRIAPASTPLCIFVLALAIVLRCVLPSSPDGMDAFHRS